MPPVSSIHVNQSHLYAVQGDRLRSILIACIRGHWPQLRGNCSIFKRQEGNLLCTPSSAGKGKVVADVG